MGGIIYGILYVLLLLHDCGCEGAPREEMRLKIIVETPAPSPQPEEEEEDDFVPRTGGLPKNRTGGGSR